MKKIIFKNFKLKNSGSVFLTQKFSYSMEANENYLSSGKKLFNEGNYKEAAWKFKKLLLPCNKELFKTKEDLDIVVSTFIKASDTNALSTILPQLPHDYTMFTMKYSILNLAILYKKEAVIKLLGRAKLLEEQLSIENANGHTPIELAVSNGYTDFFKLMTGPLFRNIDKSNLPQYERVVKLLGNFQNQDNMKIALENFYNNTTDTTTPEAEILLLGASIESADQLRGNDN
jgi:hypothetical protein